MGADNTFGETNFNPDTETKSDHKNVMKDIQHKLSKFNAECIKLKTGLENLISQIQGLEQLIEYKVKKFDKFKGLRTSYHIYPDMFTNFQNLISLRDEWRRGAKPEECKYRIALNLKYQNILMEAKDLPIETTLSFPTEQLRDGFLEYFKELIIECKPLLS